METSDTNSHIYAPDFELPGIDNRVHHLSRYLEKYSCLAVVFMSNQCPFVLEYIERLKQIQTDFAESGFTLIGINGNDDGEDAAESIETMKSFAASHKLNFPYIRDPNQDVTYYFGAKATPEVFLIDKNSVIRYRGNIDDSPKSATQVNNAYLRNSINSLLKNEPITIKLTEVVGSSIKWRENK